MAAATTANNYELEPLNLSENHKFNNNSRESKICDGKSKYLDYNWLQRPTLKLNGFVYD